MWKGVLKRTKVRVNNQTDPPGPHQRASLPKNNQRTLGSLLEPRGWGDSDPHPVGCQAKQQGGRNQSVGRVVSQATLGSFTSETWTSTLPFMFSRSAGLSIALNILPKIHSFKKVKCYFRPSGEKCMPPRVENTPQTSSSRAVDCCLVTKTFSFQGTRSVSTLFRNRSVSFAL